MIKIINEKNEKETSLEGFEKVLGRKFDCHDCNIFFRCRKDVIDDRKCDDLELRMGILDEIKLKDKEIENTKIDTHPGFQVPNPFFSNNHICPFCNREVKKKDKKGRCRLQVGKQYQWYHKVCKDSSRINPMGFENRKLKLIL